MYRCINKIIVIELFHSDVIQVFADLRLPANNNDSQAQIDCYGKGKQASMIYL